MAEAEVLRIDGPDGMREVKLSSPDKVLWPDDGYTKRDLAAYLVTVSEQFLRLGGDRPMTLQRFPEGIDGEEFFSKRPPRGAPSFLCTVTCTYPSRRRHDQLVFDEPGALAHRHAGVVRLPGEYEHGHQRPGGRYDRGQHRRHHERRHQALTNVRITP